MRPIEISGSYTSIEYSRIAKKKANDIIKSGITEENIINSFDTLGSSSIYGLTDISIISGKRIKNVKSSKLQAIEEHENGDSKSFFLIKEEGGSCSYEPIDKNYDKVITVSIIEKINGAAYQLLKFIDHDNTQEIELEEKSSEPQSISYYILGPDGHQHSFEIKSPPIKTDTQDWNAGSILSVKAKDKKSYDSFISWFRKVWLPDSPEITLDEVVERKEFSIQGPYGQLQSISSRLEAFGKFTHSVK